MKGCATTLEKIAYQTKLDKRVFGEVITGLGTFAEGCAHFSEQMMASHEESWKALTSKPQDEVLIRQIIIDHDIGYTTEAAQG